MRRIEKIIMVPLFAAGVLFVTGCSNDDVIENVEEIEDNRTLVDFSTDIPALEYWGYDIADQNVESKLADFSFRLFNAISKDFRSDGKETEKRNLSISPLSAILNMQLVANSVDDASAKAILDMMGVDDANQFNDYTNRLIRNLVAKDELAIGNSVWYNTAIYDGVSADYTSRMKSSFYADTYGMNFTEDGTVEDMNEWVKQSTLGFIDKMFTPEMIKKTNLWFVNTLFYGARWIIPFNEKKTKTGNFINYKGEKQKAEIMNDNRITGYDEKKDYTYAMLNTATSTITFILPKRGISVESLAEELSIDKINRDKSVIDIDNVVFNVDMYIPKFEAVTDIVLTDPLKSLGLKSVVMPEKIGLTPECQSGMAVDVLQKMYTSIDEKGVKVAAATATGSFELANGSAKPKIVDVKFVLDRPFLYYIRHNANGAIIMAGYVNEL